MKSFFLTIILLICFSATAQIDDFQKEIIDLLNINGTRVNYGVAYYEVFPLLKRNFKDKDIPEEAWSKLEEGEEKQVDKALAQLSFAYRKYFSREDIHTMTEFYMTDAAQKFISDETLTAEEDKQINEFLTSDVGVKMKKNQKGLNADLSTMKDQWSRELFGDKMKELVKSGYLH
jgi:Uncharacterized protein conserved in bacteria (DUF2059)